MSEWNGGAGYPFVAPLNACGTSTLGPFGNLPPGLTAYGVAFGFSPGSAFPTVHSSPASGTVP